MISYASLLDRAKSGLLTRQEVEAVARDVSAGKSRDPYTAIHILGLMRATENEQIVAAFLEQQVDPMLSRMALQVLCAHWGMSRKYRGKIEQFSRGVSWDPDSDARLAALSAAGELCRETGDRELAALLLAIFNAEHEPHLVRQAAYFALARAAGRDWLDLPPASRKLNLVADVDADVLAWAASSPIE